MFPRGKAVPRASPMFWVEQKDRYLRQLMIRDIEEMTGRALVVYFTDCGTTAQIDAGDDRYLVELLHDANGRDVDLLLETNGGVTDATEKLVAVLRQRVGHLRVAVPRRAKSNGTLLTLAADRILMGDTSELGPMDPHLAVEPGSFVPAHFIVDSGDQVDPFVHRLALNAILQTQKLARSLLATGMLEGRTEAEIERVVAELSTRDVYHSHGSVVDARAAAGLGLAVTVAAPEDELWRRLWLLRCMYEADARRDGFAKIFEGRSVSHAIRQA